MRSLYSTLEPIQPNVPYQTLLARWGQHDFEPAACRTILEELLQQRRDLEGLLSPESITSGGLVATKELLFARFSALEDWLWRATSTAGSMVSELSAEMVPDIAQLLRTISQGDGPIEADESIPEELFNVLAGAYHEAPLYGQWPAPSHPGIYRREHASLYLRSSTTTLLFDPQRSANSWTTNFQKYPSDLGGAPDAILLTHLHNDHWSTASIVMCTEPETPVIVPWVPRPSLLCELDPMRALEIVQQRALAPRWGETIQIGDFTIDVLPFYGEQPSVTRALSDPALRNWGSCYRVQCPEFSALLLVDSGSDPLGAAAEVAAMSAKKGPVDVVLSCCFSFPEVINPGLPQYAFVLPFDYVRETFLQQKEKKINSMTMGIAGVAEVCRIAQARYYLPYAHGFEGLYQTPQREDLVMHDLSNELSRQTNTTPISWLPGELATFNNGELQIKR